jgi:DNA-binding HxlR family transcriptional regulator
MITKRTYHDRCGMARALDVIGERWALHVVRELLLGPKRFTDLRAGLTGISSRVLSERLDELERVAVVQRRRLAPPAGSWVYELTDWGSELGVVIDQIGRWGARSPYLDEHATISPDALAISFRNMFNPKAASGTLGTYEIHTGEDSFVVEVRGGKIKVARGHSDAPDVVLTGEVEPIGRLIYFGGDLDDMLAAGEIGVEGNLAAMAQFLTLFGLPEPAPMAPTPA